MIGKDKDVKGEITIITKTTKFEGTIKSEGNLRVDGEVKGLIDCKGNLYVGVGGVVHADIKAHNCSISGSVVGKIASTGDTVLEDGSMVKGDIQTGQLIVNKNAKFNGMCDMLKKDKVISEKGE